ncbi:MAG: autotransporter outer membrane beta-barrel domain-containing protein [Nitrosomonadales bacterium]|nr:autotransporter outer membrane beta-barrel domain-containing protein [Nitrosomonadales bacterium]
MNTGIVKFKACGIALMGKALVAGMVTFGGMSQPVEAATADAQFRQYLVNLCNYTGNIPANWDIAMLDSMCQATVFSGSFSSGGGSVSSSSNVGVSAIGEGPRKKKYRVSLDGQDGKATQGASADNRGWGLLLTPQYSSNTRVETELENGYQSDLNGLVVGLDYRFGDNLVLGATVGKTSDKSTYLRNAGVLKTTNNSVVLYGTWVPGSAFSIDGYLGYAKLNLDNQRNVDIALVQGVINGSTSGSQRMAGMSASYQHDAGRYSVAPFLSLDFIKTGLREYTETGSTVMQGLVNIGTSTLALRHFERSRTSFTSSLGMRFGASSTHDWGVLEPSVRFAAVHEFKNKPQQINNELVSSPGYGMSLQTDALDCNYLNLGVGMAAALDNGVLLFFDFDKRAKDQLLSNWSVSVGGVVEF